MRYSRQLGGLSSLLLIGLLVGCAGQESSGAFAGGTCPACAAGMVCDPATASCVMQPYGSQCPTTCGINANCMVGGSCACAVGFDDCDGDLGIAGGSGCECTAATAAPGGGGAIASGCTAGCSEDEVCGAGNQCVKIAPTDLVGELVLDNIYSEWDKSIRRERGEVGVKIYDAQPLPADTREVVTLADGNVCHYEENSSYPNQVNGKIWPAGKRHSAGDVTFEVDKAPGPVVAKVFPSSSFGFRYSPDSPPPLKQGVTTYGGTFDPRYVPPGGALSATLAGGPDAAAAAHGGARMPADFQIDAPVADGGLKSELPSSQDLEIRWSPAQSGALMRVSLVYSYYSGGGAGALTRLVCDVPDSGKITLPRARVKKFIGQSMLTITRSHVGYYKSKASGQRELNVKLIGRVIRERRVRIGFK